MRSQRIPASKTAIAVAHGYGLRVRVENRYLVVEDGFGRQRRTRRFHRTSKLRRLVIIGHSGFVSLDALRWLKDTGAGFVHVDADGELIAASAANAPDFAALRRAQALAADSPVGLQVARDLLRLKVEGQRELLAELPDTAAAIGAADWCLKEINTVDSILMLLNAEAQAAAWYWKAWTTLPIPWPVRDINKLPGHWRTFGRRASLITGGPRLATNPANSILNYLYALLEAETILACHAVGLDPGVGVFHTDQRDRSSLALDLMEAVRPVVDAYVLALLTQRTLSPREFVETRDGACRMAPRFAAELADTCTVWRAHVAPVVEQTAHTLAEHSPAVLPALTPLTRSNYKRAWDERAPDHRQRRSRSDFARLPATCRGCGAPLTDRRRRFCDQCRATLLREQGPAARRKAGEVLAQLRAEQRDPAHGGRPAEIRGAKNAVHQAAVRDWQGERPDPEVFRTEILPGLRRKPIAELMASTGLGQSYCGRIRTGRAVPHPRHWDALREASSEPQDPLG